jgi:hypothetical protein
MPAELAAWLSTAGLGLLARAAESLSLAAQETHATLD